MAIQTLTRNVVSPVPPLRLMQEMPGATEDLLEKWLPQFLSKLYADRIDTFTTVQILSGVPADVLILPSGFGIWFVTVNIGKVGNAAQFQAAALIAVDATTARAIVTWNAPLQTIVLTGLTISSVQSSGAAFAIFATAIKLTNF